MTAVDKLEFKHTGEKSIFDLKLGLNILAFSLPFSTAVILAICSYSHTIIRPEISFLVGLIFVIVESKRIDKQSNLYNTG